jgi:hypothetical protein
MTQKNPRLDRAFLGDPRQGYHHNVIAKVLEDRGFDLVRIKEGKL